MRETWMFLFVFLIALTSFSQKKVSDSLLHVVDTATYDGTKVRALCLLSRHEPDNNKSYNYVANALAIARSKNLKKEEALCYRAMGTFFVRLDYGRSLEYHLKSLQISEELKDSVNIALMFTEIGNTYRLQENPKSALPYFFQALAIYQNHSSGDLANTYNLIGICYEKLGKTDSALSYFNRGYEVSSNENTTYASRILRGLGNVHTEKGDVDLALSFYRKSLLQADVKEDSGERCQTFIQLSKLFSKINTQDSALFYGEQAMHIAQLRNSKPLIGWAAKQLATVYEPIDPKESLRYYKLSTTTTESIFGAESQRQTQQLTFNELERQREIREAKLKEAEERSHNLQYAAIAFGLITLLIGFLVFSHSVIANQKLIRFLGVVSLLIVFEFLNLLLHPWLGAITHHSPVWMLLIMVCVAAVLVPLHHKLEHWIINRLVEKNKKVRLAAAKRTIQQLESESDMVVVNKEVDTEQQPQ